MQGHKSRRWTPGAQAGTLQTPAVTTALPSSAEPCYSLDPWLSCSQRLRPRCASENLSLSVLVVYPHFTGTSTAQLSPMAVLQQVKNIFGGFATSVLLASAVKDTAPLTSPRKGTDPNPAAAVSK